MFGKRKKAGSILALSAMLLASFSSVSSAAGSSVTLYKDTTYQTIWGFGAAANHPVNELKNNYTSAVQSQILDKLFKVDESNAGLSMVRLEINPYTSSEDAVQTTFMPSDGVLDWNTDLHQRWFAQEAKNRGMNQFYAVPWSPPGWMKDNGSPNIMEGT
ncbi:glycoside hydrolase [Paenibacillus hexagrammi]|uniref:Glycosyl hydrolase family 59 catalytic domain-containing protein n=1 Tax=Paenibacillus hexagrammi TaxID=2908839 RepID=A0ABY3SGB6_9BACL|nr:glycoside hydrolase [Paenibacillus sp. YPD9-1]UJF32503.1 hypothetical protein L0M14_22940 [Paenibacillus sp. YPD9-1]